MEISILAWWILHNTLRDLLINCELVVLSSNSKHIITDVDLAFKLKKELNRDNVLIACLVGSFCHDHNLNESIEKNLKNNFPFCCGLFSLRYAIEKARLILISPPTYRSHPSPFESGLRSDGKRMTPQRKKVLSLFEEIGSGIHLSAEEVHSKLTISGEKVSLATIYRTLRLLVKMTFLNELDLSEGGNRRQGSKF